MYHQNIQPFILKTGNSLNNQPNDDGPNSKPKSHYNEVKSMWMMKYMMKKVFTSPHELNYGISMEFL